MEAQGPGCVTDHSLHTVSSWSADHDLSSESFVEISPSKDGVDSPAVAGHGLWKGVQARTGSEDVSSLVVINGEDSLSQTDGGSDKAPILIHIDPATPVKPVKVPEGAALGTEKSREAPDPGVREECAAGEQGTTETDAELLSESLVASAESTPVKDHEQSVSTVTSDQQEDEWRPAEQDQGSSSAAQESTEGQESPLDGASPPSPSTGEAAMGGDGDHVLRAADGAKTPTECLSFTMGESWDRSKVAPADDLWTTRRDGVVRLRVEQTGPGSEPPLTMHQLFRQTVQRYGDRPALATRRDGRWETITYLQYYQDCRAAAKGFLKLGLEPFHGVGIMGFNCMEWFISDIAAIMAGGFAVGIYTTNSPEACQYVADNCEANVLLVENHRQLAKILQVQDQLPHLKAIIQYHDELKEKRPNLYTWKELMQLGSDVQDSLLDEIIASQKANQCCTLIYTSGTTGNSKGVMLSHDNGSLVTTLQEARPTSFLGVPRVWEKIQEKMKAAGAKSSLIQRKVAAWAKGIGLHASYSQMNGNNCVPWGYTLANILVFRRVSAALGLDRCTKCITSAAPITKDTLEYFMSLKMPLLEIYGMSECTGPQTVSLPSSFRIMSCGKDLLGCKTRIDKPDEDGNGEICFWGRHIFMGYLNMKEKTEEALDEEGWLHSGDLGKQDQEGFLYITGRIKELIITAGGENIPPIPIEDRVKEEVPIISNAMLIGDKRKFLSMLLTLKCNTDGETGEPQDELTPEAVKLCQQLGSRATRVSDVIGSKDPAVYKAIQEGVERVNRRAVSNAQRVQKWTILSKDFSVLGGELGPTMKLKRPVVSKMYREEIDGFYKE
ncbi:long-chain-fatty-acid--CoA ligase ACSBG2-like isoform X2 [Rhinatrema bivittatum]|uniref:long-chain-fatty-acid--CoA ligase ACSBG2-like isoform X2 n=1 Tax=Rhinatrema bivittatum TaxID=194408 RepID=UPI00112D9F75|nr:long-chain-fatty-acid--CoA ligase ACSBG2-like isoform X2 [Rhinatrema bivittatum]